MARDTTKYPTPDAPDDDPSLDAHVMVRVTKRTKDLIAAKARASGVAPATWARIQIIRGLMRKEK